MSKIVFALVLILLSLDGFSKDLDVAGFYVKPDGDTVDCRYKIPLYRDADNQFQIDFTKLQRKVRVIHADNSKRSLKPKNIISYSFFNEYNQYRFYSVPDNLRLFRFMEKDPKILLLNECDGYIKLYSLYRKKLYYMLYLPFQPHVAELRSRYYYQKGELKIVKIKEKQFEREVESWYPDCPTLKEKMSNKYEPLNIHGKINIYNECMANR